MNLHKTPLSDKRPEERDDEDRKRVHASVNAFSRVMAVMVMMMLPGVIGYFLDKWLGTGFLIVVGFVIGMMVAILGLIFVAKQANVELQKSKNK